MNVTFWNFPTSLVVTNNKTTFRGLQDRDIQKSLFADWFPLIFGEVFKYRLGNISGEINPELPKSPAGRKRASL